MTSSWLVNLCFDEIWLDMSIFVAGLHYLVGIHSSNHVFLDKFIIFLLSVLKFVFMVGFGCFCCMILNVLFVY